MESWTNIQSSSNATSYLMTDKQKTKVTFMSGLQDLEVIIFHTTLCCEMWILTEEEVYTLEHPGKGYK